MASRPGGLLGFACCCIPRQWLVGLFGLLYFCYGMSNVSYVLINLLLAQGQAPNHIQTCVGGDCQAIVSCEGLKDASYHVHMSVTIFGGVYFCGTGLLGIVNHHSDGIVHLGYFFQIMAVVSLLLLIADGSYTASCSSYPQNIIDAAVMWPVANQPTSERQKQLIHGMAYFPKHEVDSLLDFNLWYFYVTVIFFLNIWYHYLAVQVTHIADMLQHGFYGLGRNYDFAEWRDAVKFNESLTADFSSESQPDAYGATDDGVEEKMQQKLGEMAKNYLV